MLPLVAGITAVLFLTGLLALRGWVQQRTRGRLYEALQELASGPPVGAALVFGAGYWPSGRLSEALADRMELALALYEAGIVNKLLLTGDNRYADYNEPAAMAAYARTRGVPEEDLVLDYAGRRTYDSCYRAKAIFGLEQAVLVTQRFHMPRALYTCERLGVEAVGLVADQRRYARGTWYELRELLALGRAWLDLQVFKPLPVLGDPIPVDWNHRAGASSQ